MVKNQGLIPNTDTAEMNTGVIAGKNNGANAVKPVMQIQQQQQQQQSSKISGKKFLPSLLSRASPFGKDVDGGNSSTSVRLKLPFNLGSGSTKQHQQQQQAVSVEEIPTPVVVSGEKVAAVVSSSLKKKNMVSNVTPPVDNVNVRHGGGLKVEGIEGKSTNNSRTHSSSNESSKMSSLTDPFDLDAKKKKSGMMMIPWNTNPPIKNIYEERDSQIQLATDMSTISGSTFYNHFHHQQSTVSKNPREKQQYDNGIDRRDPVPVIQDNLNGLKLSSIARADPPDNQVKETVVSPLIPRDNLDAQFEKIVPVLQSITNPIRNDYNSGIAIPSHGEMDLKNSRETIESPFLSSIDKNIAVEGSETNRSKIIAHQPKAARAHHSNSPPHNTLANDESEPTNQTNDRGGLKDDQHSNINILASASSNKPPPASAKNTSRKMEYGKVKALLDRVHLSSNSRSGSIRTMNLPPVGSGSSSMLFTQRTNSGVGQHRSGFAASSSISHQDSKSVAMEHSVTTEVIANGMAAMKRRAANAALKGRKQQPKQQEISTTAATTNTDIFSSIIAEADNDEETDEEQEQPVHNRVGGEQIKEANKEDPSTSSSLTTRSSSSLSSSNNNIVKVTEMNDNKPDPSSTGSKSGSITKQEDNKTRSLPPRPTTSLSIPSPPPPPPLQRKPLEPPENDLLLFINSTGNKFKNRRSSIDAPEVQPIRQTNGHITQDYGSPDSSKVESVMNMTASEDDENQQPNSIKGSYSIFSNDVGGQVDDLKKQQQNDEKSAQECNSDFVSDTRQFVYPVQGYDISEMTVPRRDPSVVGSPNHASTRKNLLPTPTGVDRSNDMNARSDPDYEICQTQSKGSNTHERIIVQPGTDIITSSTTQLDSPASGVPIVDGVDTVFSTYTKAPTSVKSSGAIQYNEVVENEVFASSSAVRVKSDDQHISQFSTDFWNKNGRNCAEVIDLTDPFGDLQKKHKTKVPTRKLRSNPFETTDDEESKTRSDDPYKPEFDELSDDEDSIPVPPSFDQSISNSRLSPMSSRRKKRGSAINSTTSKKKQMSPRRSSTRLKKSSISGSPLTDKINQYEHHGKKSSNDNCKNVGGLSLTKHSTVEEPALPVVKANSYFDLQEHHPIYSQGFGDISRQNSRVALTLPLPNEIAMSREDPVSDLDQSFRHFPLKHIAADASVDVSALDTVRYASDIENGNDEELEDDFASIRKTSLLEYSISTDGNGTYDTSSWIRDKKYQEHHIPRTFGADQIRTHHRYAHPEYRNSSLYQGRENIIPSFALADSATGEWTLDQRESKDSLSLDEQQRSQFNFHTNTPDLAQLNDKQNSIIHGEASYGSFGSGGGADAKEIQRFGCGVAAIAATVVPLLWSQNAARMMLRDGKANTENYDSTIKDELERKTNSNEELVPFLEDAAELKGHVSDSIKEDKVC